MFQWEYLNLHTQVSYSSESLLKIYATEAIHCRLHNPCYSNMDTSIKSTHLVVLTNILEIFTCVGLQPFLQKQSLSMNFLL
jgi:hypothetical protein